MWLQVGGVTTVSLCNNGSEIEFPTGSRVPTDQYQTPKSIKSGMSVVINRSRAHPSRRCAKPSLSLASAYGLSARVTKPWLVHRAALTALSIARSVSSNKIFNMLRFLYTSAVLLGFALIVGAAAAWFAFGGGRHYPDLTTAPILGRDALEAAVVFERPIGNAAVAADGRIFFTVHPESHPENPKLYVWNDDEARPFPDAARQSELFQSPLGLAIDRHERLWIIDPGHHGLGDPTLTAIDLASGEIVHRHHFNNTIAPPGSFLQDLQIDSNGRYVYIADVGFWAKRPALIVYDVEADQARRLLNRHESVYPQNYLIRTPLRDMSYFGGLLAMKTGIDGIAISRDDAWLYFAAMNHSTMYRAPTRLLNDFTADEQTIEAALEAVGTKPLNDGLSTDDEGNVFITDVEHQAVVKLTPDGRLETLIKDQRIRWADGLSFGPDGWLYLADSAIPHLVLRSASYIAGQSPFYIWRFKPGSKAAAGQ